jgi:hypothetical protein
MFRSFVAAILTFLVVAGASAQSSHKPMTTASGALSDSFAVESIKALRGVQRDNYNVSSIGKDLPTSESHAADAAIDDLDASARTAAEEQVVKALQTFHAMKIIHNMAAEAMQTMVEADIMSREPNADPVMMGEVVDHSPMIISIKAKERACGDQLEAALRQRRFKSAPACSEDALYISSPKSIDFDVMYAEVQVKQAR